MSDLIRESCEEFTALLASEAPVPGGGGAAALAGALAAALGAMAASLSAGRKKTTEERAALSENLVRAERQRQQLLALVDADAAGFSPLAKAYALPKDDPNRPETLRAASLRACEAPMAMLHCCAETVELLAALQERVSPLLLSDVGCAAALCRGAMEAAAMNVWVNTKSLEDDGEAAKRNADVRAILEIQLPRAAAIVAAVRARLEDGWEQS